MYQTGFVRCIFITDCVVFTILQAYINLKSYEHFIRSIALSLFVNAHNCCDLSYGTSSGAEAKVRKTAKIRNRYNQAPHLTQDTNGKVTRSQIHITNESQEVSPFPAGDRKASTNRRA